MKNKYINYEKINFSLLLILPLSLLFGTLISEIIIFFINLIFLSKSYIKKDWEWTKNIEFKFLIFIWIYLILNSIFSNNFSLSVSRGLFFFRFILLAFAVSEILKNLNFRKKIFTYWIALVLLVSIDIYVEFFFKKNLLGNYSLYPDRIASFTGKELKIGHYLLALFLLPFSFFIDENNYKNTKIYLGLLFFLAFIGFAILATGERSNSIRAIFCLLLFIALLKKKNQLVKYIILVFFIISSYVAFTNINIIKNRYAEIVENINKPIILLKGSQHGAHYTTAWKIFKNYPYLGVGNKNFREECEKSIYVDSSYKFTAFRCSTHPHQIYLEFLSELGILGTLLIVSFIFFIIKKALLIYLKNYKSIILAPILYIASTFLPIIPSGSFFTSFGATLFWLNIGIMFSLYKKNIK
jgi:O-antigen ligase